MKQFDLGDPVSVPVRVGDVLRRQPAKVIGRTREQVPHYDVLLADGRHLSNLPSRDVREVSP